MVTSGFFNAIDHDRTYSATQISSIFDGIIRDGILDSYGKCFIVEPNDGMIVNVGTGRAWFNHTWTLNDSAVGITIAQSELLLNRIDAIVLETNSDISVRANTIKYIQGEPATQPAKPELINDVTIHQYPLAYITVNAGVTEITASNIENMVGSEATPFANGLMEQITTDKLYTQWASQFIDWWNGLRLVMTDEVAGNLQNEIDALKIWVAKNEKIDAGVDTYVIEDLRIKSNSIVEVYYSPDSLYEAGTKSPTYLLEDGKITISFSGVLSKDVTIEGVHIINI